MASAPQDHGMDARPYLIDEDDDDDVEDFVSAELCSRAEVAQRIQKDVALRFLRTLRDEERIMDLPVVSSRVHTSTLRVVGCDKRII
jgi:hypothetical protein